MKNAGPVRLAGLVGMFGAALWVVALFVEYAYDLFSCEGALCGVNQAMFLVAQLCYLAVIAGLMRVRAAGDGWPARISLGLFFFGWAALASALLMSALGLPLPPELRVFDLLTLVGAVASTLGGFLTGIAVAAAGRLRGLWRLAPLIQGLYQLVAFLRVVLAGQEPTQLTESLWAGTWFLMGLALFVSARKEGPTDASRRCGPRDGRAVGRTGPTCDNRGT